MGKRNKKKKKQPQHVKQTEAEQRKAFFSNFFRVLKLYDCDKIRSFLDKSQRDYIFDNRIRYPQIVAAKGHDVSPAKLRDMKTVLFKQLVAYEVEIKPGGPFISLMDHYTINTTLICIKSLIKKNNKPGWKNFTDTLDNFIDFEDLCKRAEQSSCTLTFVFGMVFTELERQLYWAETKFDFNSDKSNELCYIYEVFTAKPEIISHKIDGKKRQIYRVGWGSPAYKAKWVTLLPEKINIPGLFSNLPIPVYFQSHVLHRLEERLDCFVPGCLQFKLYESLEKPVFVNFEGRMLIEYHYMNEIKYGYLVVEYIEGFILVKTFLFLTNNGTPEGKKLEELSGLSKLDKKYWAIDKHSTFLTSDLANNEKLKTLFTEAGCEKLFEPVETDLEINECKEFADKMMNYMNRDGRTVNA